MTDQTGEEPPLVAETIARMGLSLMPFGSAIDIMLTDTRKRIESRVRQTVTEVCHETGEELLARRLAESPEVEAVFVQGVETAARTGYEQKRRLLSRVVAAAVLDDAKVDEGLLFVMALRDLDAPHLRTLEAMRRAIARAQRRGVPVFPPEIPDPSPALRIDNAVSSAIRDDTEGVPTPVITALARTGAIVIRPSGGSIVATGAQDYRVSPFGERLLDYLASTDD